MNVTNGVTQQHTLTLTHTHPLSSCSNMQRLSSNSHSCPRRQLITYTTCCFSATFLFCFFFCFLFFARGYNFFSSQFCVYLSLYAHHLSSSLHNNTHPAHTHTHIPHTLSLSCINFHSSIIMIVINLNRKYSTVS